MKKYETFKLEIPNLVEKCYKDQWDELEDLDGSICELRDGFYHFEEVEEVYAESEIPQEWLKKTDEPLGFIKWLMRHRRASEENSALWENMWCAWDAGIKNCQLKHRCSYVTNNKMDAEKGS
jgi:hypothetical protein